MRMGCAHCQCVIEAGVRVTVCDDASRCCCADLPVAAQHNVVQRSGPADQAANG